jgi:hypothetical protein
MSASSVILKRGIRFDWLLRSVTPGLLSFDYFHFSLVQVFMAGAPWNRLRPEAEPYPQRHR